MKDFDLSRSEFGEKDVFMGRSYSIDTKDRFLRAMTRKINKKRNI